MMTYRQLSIIILRPTSITFTTKLFNNIFMQENFPASWSIGKIKPLYKKGDPSNPKNYKVKILL